MKVIHQTDTHAIAADLAGQSLTLRPITAQDEAFLRKVYIGTRMEELAVTDWSAIQKEAFLTSQFAAQHAYYQKNYARAAFLIIERQGQQIGRFYLDRWPDQIRVVDIALLPAYRRKGFGMAILKAVLAEGQRLSLPVTIHVERFNPALRLYTRLGFAQIEDKGVYFLLEKQPDAR